MHAHASSLTVLKTHIISFCASTGYIRRYAKPRHHHKESIVRMISRQNYSITINWLLEQVIKMKVLVATDGSECSEIAFQHVLNDRSLPNDCEFKVISVVE